MRWLHAVIATTAAVRTSRAVFSLVEQSSRSPCRGPTHRRDDETWRSHILVFLNLGVTNARTEGFHRIVKQVTRTGCGCRNIANYQRRIMSHIGATRAA